MPWKENTPMSLRLEFLALAKAYPAVARGLCEQFRLNRALLQRELGLADEAQASQKCVSPLPRSEIKTDDGPE